MFYKKAILICVLFLMYSPAAFAGGGPSPENCKAVGSALVRCYDCGSERRYLGDVAVLTDYEEDRGKKYCVKASDAKQACSNRFGVPSYNIGFYTKFRIGTGTREETYNTTCVEQVGH